MPKALPERAIVYRDFGDMAARARCGGCGSNVIRSTEHGLMWCKPCFERVQDAMEWQLLYRTMHPDECRETPGAAAVAYLHHLTKISGRAL